MRALENQNSYVPDGRGADAIALRVRGLRKL